MNFKTRLELRRTPYRCFNVFIIVFLLAHSLSGLGNNKGLNNSIDSLLQDFSITGKPILKNYYALFDEYIPSHNSKLLEQHFSFSGLFSETDNFNIRFRGRENIQLKNTIQNFSIQESITVSHFKAASYYSEYAPPNAICKNITIELQSNGTVSIVPSDIDGGSTDDVAIVLRSLNKSNFSCSDLGENTITLTVNDSTQTDSCTAVVTVEDSINPVINCAGSITVSADPGVSTYDINQLSPPTSTDNCSVVSVLANPSTLNLGTNTITWTSTDSSNNSSACTQSVTVEDDENPVAHCKNFTLPLNASGQATLLSSDINNNSTDNVGITSLSLSKTNFNCSDVGTNTVTLTVTDANGNTGTCTANVTVQDNVSPVAACKNITVQLDAAGSATITEDAVNNDSSDTCGGLSYDTDITTFDCTDVGPNTVIFTVTDVNGNTDSCTATVTVEDNEDPVAACKNITVQLDTAGSATIAEDAVNNGSSDACDGLIYDTDITTFDCTDIGPNTVNLTVTDANGNTDTCMATVTVRDNVDPVATCKDITVQLDSSGSATIAEDAVNIGSSDACDGLTYDTDITIFDCANVGINTVTLTVTDANGNTDTCTATVTVEDNVDPVAACKSISVTLGANNVATITEDAVNNNSNDACGGLSFDTDITTFDCSDVGNNTVTLTVTDANGNSDYCSTIVIVEESSYPNPTFTYTSNAYCENDTNPSPNFIAESGGSFNSSAGLDIDSLTGEINIFNSNPGDYTITYSFPAENGRCSVAQSTYDLTLNKFYDTSNLKIVGCAYLDTDNNPTCPSSERKNQLVACHKNGRGQLHLNIPDEDLPFISRWEYSRDAGQNWTSLGNAGKKVYDFSNIDVATAFRAVIDTNTGSPINACGEQYSLSAMISIIPEDLAPSPVSANPTEFCLGGTSLMSSTVSYGIDQINDDGGFQTGQINSNDYDSWLIDGDLRGFASSGNNVKENNWSGTNSKDVTVNGVNYYLDSGSPKFAISSGNENKNQQNNDLYKENGIVKTIIETPIFKLLSLEDATFEFDEVYILTAGSTCDGASYPAAQAIIKISTDGGENYTEFSDDLISANHRTNDGNMASEVGPAKSGKYNGFNRVIIDLKDYFGQTDLRIKFEFIRNCESIWAIDNFQIPEIDAVTQVRWTNQFGSTIQSIAGTDNVNVTPQTPGQQIFTVTTYINGCEGAAPDGHSQVPLKVDFAYAGPQQTVSPENCGGYVTLHAYDNYKSPRDNYLDYKAEGTWDSSLFTINDVDGNGVWDADEDFGPTNEAGVWSIDSGPGGLGIDWATVDASIYFTEIADPRSEFFGPGGDYTLVWTVNNCPSTVNVTLRNCTTLNYDGVNDYVDFGDIHNFVSNFTIEAWIKSNRTNNSIQTLYSKRDASNLSTGFDLRIVSNSLIFSFNNTQLKSSHQITQNRWFHTAVTYDGSSYKLYVDGILVGTKSGALPTINSMNFLMGAMDKTGNVSVAPTNYYNGWLDEFRVWNVALTDSQIRPMMNQEIYNNGAKVNGEILPFEIAGLNWSNLTNYYQMKQPSDISLGKLLDNAGDKDGVLNNITTWQDDTAPLPYVTKSAGNWADTSANSPWLYGQGIWDHPNSNGINGSAIDWNIVKTNHDITMNSQDLVLLGLIVEDNELTITNSGKQDELNTGHGLTITHYLRIDGMIDLVGKSQLIQKRYNEDQIMESTLEPLSSGLIERDQQGTSNLYNYNYWSSPVSLVNSSDINKPFTLLNVLKDGSSSDNPSTPQFNGSYDASGSSNPVNLSDRWIYVYKNFPQDTYAAWEYLGPDKELPVGLAFTLKGSGVNKDYQNYVFKGKPNNGTISTPISSGNQALTGNPYPSAIDADEFIKDNIPGESANAGSEQSMDGSLYYWDHYESNETHVLREYQGGYAVYNLSGGVKAFSPALVSGLGLATKVPGRYIPVGQGFFVTSSPSGGTVKFKNKHRVFNSDDSNSSTFMRTRSGNNAAAPIENQSMQRIKLGFALANGTSRELLISFTDDNSATDGFDYGYDALNNDHELPIDIAWMVDDKKCVIQGVGNFDKFHQYPLGLYMNQPDKIKISLISMENFDEHQNIYVYDVLLGTTTPINDFDFEMYMDIGTYVERFFITFHKEETTLGIKEVKTDKIILNYFSSSKEIYVNAPKGVMVKQVNLVNMVGQRIKTWDASNSPISNDFRIKVDNIAEGNYIIQLETDLQTINKKAIINK